MMKRSSFEDKDLNMLNKPQGGDQDPRRNNPYILIGGDDDEIEYDELYDLAVAYVVDQGKASTSMIQRQFKIGYNRAARMIEVMEKEGVVGAADGARPRKILVGGHVG